MFQLIEDVYELKALKSFLNVKNPYKQVEIYDQFGFNCLKKYTWFVKTSFTEVDELRVNLNDRKNVFEVLNKLEYLNVYCVNN